MTISVENISERFEPFLLAFILWIFGIDISAINSVIIGTILSFYLRSNNILIVIFFTLPFIYGLCEMTPISFFITNLIFETSMQIMFVWLNTRIYAIRGNLIA